MAHASRRATVYITDEAWNQIERSDYEERRLLLHLACISAARNHYHVHLAVTALFENAALRRSCVRLAA
ncbi:MAG: hypothetical protein ACREM1_24740 [Longimicrobiales bacterium]